MNYVEAQPTLAHLVRELALRWPQRIALTFDGAGVREHDRCTYRQLWTRSTRLAAGLSASGLREGDRFALVMANHREFVECMVAAAIACLVFVSIDPRTKPDRLAAVLRHAGCRAIIAADYTLATVAQACREVQEISWTAVVKSGEVASRGTELRDYESLVRDSSDAEAIKASPGLHPMQLIYTSGTTGDPKGIFVTHERYVQTCLSVARTFGYREDDRLYSALSLTHANAQLISLGAGFFCGVEVVFSRRFSKSALWDVLRRHGCTTFTLLGGMTSAIYAQPPSEEDKRHSVRFVVSAGMPKAIWQRFEHRFGLRVLEFWGTAEGGIAVNPPGTGPVGSFGKLVPSLQHRVVDDEDRPVAPGQPGELQIRHADGRPFLVEYQGEPEASKRKCRGGWMRSGDIVHQDEEGWLFFHHRRGSEIRRNGEFVNPAVIERVIAETGMAADVYVYGLHEDTCAPGEKRVIAAVVPAALSFDESAMREQMCERLESSQLPDVIQVVTEIPKTASEKPQDRFLIDLLSRT